MMNSINILPKQLNIRKRIEEAITDYNDALSMDEYLDLFYETPEFVINGVDYLSYSDEESISLKVLLFVKHLNKVLQNLNKYNYGIMKLIYLCQYIRDEDDAPYHELAMKKVNDNIECCFFWDKYERFSYYLDADEIKKMRDGYIDKFGSMNVKVEFGYESFCNQAKTIIEEFKREMKDLIENNSTFKEYDYNYFLEYYELK